MKMSIFIAILLTNLTFTMTAQASYVESCQLQGKVASIPETKRFYFINEQNLEVEREETTFQFKVMKSKISGRADSKCVHFLGQAINVKLNGGCQLVKNIKKSQNLTLNYTAKDSETSPMQEHFWLPSILDMPP